MNDWTDALLQLLVYFIERVISYCATTARARHPIGNTDEFVSVFVFLISNRSKENKVEGICLAVDDSVTTCQHLSTQPSLPLRISKL